MHFVNNHGITVAYDVIREVWEAREDKPRYMKKGKPHTPLQHHLYTRARFILPGLPGLP